MFGLELLEADDGEVFNEAFLDLLEPVMVLVELFAGAGEEAAVPEFIRRRCICIGGGRWPRDRSNPFKLQKYVNRPVTN